MRGVNNGVSTIIASKESRAIFTHCYGHALNLGVGDTIKQCQLMKSALEVVTDIEAHQEVTQARFCIPKGKV